MDGRAGQGRSRCSRAGQAVGFGPRGGSGSAGCGRAAAAGRLAEARAPRPGQDGAPPPPVRDSAARRAAPRPARSWAGDVVMEKLRRCRSPAA